MNEICVKEIDCCGCPEMDACTMKKKDNLINKLFSRYGSASKYAEHTIHVWEVSTKEIKTQKEIISRMEHAQKTIEQLENYILMLQAYKIDLANRYNYLEISPKREKIKLERYKKYKGNVFYYLIFSEINLLDGEENETNRETYTGKEKKKACNRFEELKKERKNAIFEKDIEKKSWEK